MLNKNILTDSHKKTIYGPVTSEFSSCMVFIYEKFNVRSSMSEREMTSKYDVYGNGNGIDKNNVG